MIIIDRLIIKKFRGIIDLDIELNGENLAICGPNGTGKSGVVDAIEFVLSGDISRLSGKGRGNVSVKSHAPHVDYRDDPASAIVELHGRIASSGTAFKIRRSVDQVKEPEIEPNNSEVNSVLVELGLHKSVTLSRRELIEYILSTPGDRAAEIQALLQLDKLVDLRKNFQKISNAKKRGAKLASDNKVVASRNLTNALAIPKLNSKSILSAVNERRKVLGLPAIEELTAKTSVKDGLSVVASGEAKALSKSVATEDLKSFFENSAHLNQPEFKDNASAALELLEPLAKSTDFLTSLDRQDLLQSARKLVGDDGCPVCETEWEKTALLEKIDEKLESLSAQVALKDKIEALLAPTITSAQLLLDSASNVRMHAAKLKPIQKCSILNEHEKLIESSIDHLRAFNSIQPMIDALNAISVIPETALDEAKLVSTEIAKLPDTSKKDAARDYLVAVDERLDAFREQSRAEKSAQLDADVAKRVFETYEQAHEDGLNEVYKLIQDTFASLYRQMNSDDEGAFEASMVASGAQLGLDVDFYGRGKFPPGAYHSEGHQDGMGLCLYLALMSHLHQDGFTFCVLDDVLMSVDGAHRLTLCNLLVERFPKTQFVFTTHDDVWLKKMQTTGLVKTKNCVHFRNWTVEDGPAEWRTLDPWAEIKQSVDNNDIEAAASSLRRYLEFLSREICHNLRAQVVYRGDNQHALGDLLPRATSRFSELLKEAAATAKKWENDEEAEGLNQKLNDFKTAVHKSNIEQWSLNAKVHYNEWANLDKNDFLPVVSAFEELVAFLRCDKCKAILYLNPSFGPKEALRCVCAQNNFNLKKKG